MLKVIWQRGKLAASGGMWRLSGNRKKKIQVTLSTNMVLTAQHQREDVLQDSGPAFDCVSLEECTAQYRKGESLEYLNACNM